MKIRRIVTGRDAQGNSVFVSDADAPRSVAFKHVPGHAVAQVWSTSAGDRLPHSGADPTAKAGSLVPRAPGTSLLVVDFPPDSVMMEPAFDHAAAGAELAAALPGLIDCFEPDSPGMHTTPTIDYGIVLTGEIWLELDDGMEKLVRAGDIVVQNGTRHAWRNRSATPVRVAFVLVGAAW